MQALRTVYRYWMVLVALAVLVQIGAAGYGAFYAADKSDPGPMTEDQFSHGFDFHGGFGYIILYATVVALLLALGARLGRRRVLMVGGLVVLVIVQILLAWGGESVPAVGIFHPLVAFVIAAYSGRLAYEAWRLGAAEPARPGVEVA